MNALIQIPRSNLQLVFAACISLCLPLSGTAQTASTTTPNSADVRTGSSLPAPVKLNYEDPVTYPVGTKQSGIIVEYKCSADGSVYLPIVEDSSQAAQGRAGALIKIVGLTPSGDVIRFTPPQISGYQNLIPLIRYFVSGSRVYVLEMADKIDSTDLRKVTGRSRFIQVFDLKGQAEETITIDPDVAPLSIAAFASGEILTFSPGSLNQTTRVLLFDAHGSRETELSLFDNDFGRQLNLAAKDHGGRTLWELLSGASIVPQGDNLLVTSHLVDLPVLELNQRGLVRATRLALPPGATLGWLIRSDDGLMHALVGEVHTVPATGPVSGSPPPEPARSFSPTEIDEFYQDGSLFRRIAIAPRPMPVCESKGSYVFLGRRQEDGRLQLTRATPVTQ